MARFRYFSPVIVTTIGPGWVGSLLMIDSCVVCVSVDVGEYLIVILWDFFALRLIPLAPPISVNGRLSVDGST
jgi:hypothetical protein